MEELNYLLKSIKPLLDSLPYYVMLVDEEHTVLVANKAVEGALGVKPEEITGGYCPRVVHGYEEPYPGCPLEESLEKGKGPVEKEVYNSDLNVWTLSCVYPTPFSHRGKTVFWHTVEDITERKEAEEKTRRYGKELEERNRALKETIAELDSAYRELYLLREVDEALSSTLELEEVLNIIVRGIVDNLGYDSCAIHLLDRDGKYLINKDYIIDSSVVKKLEKLTGLKISNYRIPVYEGSLFHKIITERRPILTINIEEAVKSHTLDKRIWKLSRVIARVSGVKSGVGVPLVAKGRVLGVIGVGSRGILTTDDMEKLQNYAGQTSLAIMQAEMYEELKMAKDEINSAYLELKEIDRVKNDIISNVSHELKTPLTIAELAMEEHMEKENGNGDKKILEKAFKALKRQEKIVDSLMEFARTERGEFSLNLRKINLARVIEKALHQKRKEIEDKGLEVESDLNEIEVLGDLNRLETVVSNVLENAIKFNRRGGKVKLKTERVDDKAKIIIKDTGIGLKKSEVSRIFEPLTQLDRKASRLYPGTGMGLAVAKRVVEQHRGSIEVESAPGEGSQFTILLPVNQNR